MNKHAERSSRTITTALSGMSGSSPYACHADAETFITPCPAEGLDNLFQSESDFNCRDSTAAQQQHSKIVTMAAMPARTGLHYHLCRVFDAS